MRTGNAAATSVIAVQKPSRIRSMSAGNGTETRTRIRAAAAITGKINGRRGEGTLANHGSTRCRICEANVKFGDSSIAKAE
jgi:hypothetical protein